MPSDMAPGLKQTIKSKRIQVIKFKEALTLKPNKVPGTDHSEGPQV